jgi:hypothetical protein
VEKLAEDALSKGDDILMPKTLDSVIHDMYHAKEVCVTLHCKVNQLEVQHVLEKIKHS